MAYGCFNRQPFKEHHPALDGVRCLPFLLANDQIEWLETPKNISIAHTMTRDCQYTKQASNDPGCQGCRHRSIS